MKREIIAYKATDLNMKCNGFKFEFGKTFYCDEDKILGKNGFDAYLNPIFIKFSQFTKNSRFFKVLLSGEIYTDRGGTIISSEIKFLNEFTLKEYVEEIQKYLYINNNKGSYSLSIADTSNNIENYCVSSNFENNSNSSNTGNLCLSNNTGKNSISSCTGYLSMSYNKGERSVSSNTNNISYSNNIGKKSISCTTSIDSVSLNEGEYSISCNTGERSIAFNNGTKSLSCNTSRESKSINEGNSSISCHTGEYGSSVNTGIHGIACSTGDYSEVEANGICGVAIATQRSSKVRGKNGSALILFDYKSENEISKVVTAIVGQNGIKEDVWYTLNVYGEFKEF